jgi:MSHA biogenesis protein MshJ
MMRRWLRNGYMLFARINTLGLRARVLLFLLVIAIPTVLVFWLLLWPAQGVYTKLTEDFNIQRAVLNDAREELKSSAMPVSDTQVLRDQIAAVKNSFETAHQVLLGAELQQNKAPLTEILFETLRRHDGLVLLHKSAFINGSSIDDTGEIDTTTLPIGLSRQRVELTVSGPYVQLMLYTQALEDALPTVRWGDMVLKRDGAATELTLQLFVIGEYPL